MKKLIVKFNVKEKSKLPFQEKRKKRIYAMVLMSPL